MTEAGSCLQSEPRQSVITVAEVAERLEISPATWRSYVARDQAPAAESHIGNLPLWKLAMVEAWVTARPGRGRWGRD